MKVKLIVIVILAGAVLFGTISFYRYYYVRTLMLSEIVGKTDNSLINLAVNSLDFDTGLTRHEIKQLNDKKDYWTARINQLAEIQDTDQKQEATVQLLADFFDDPAVKRLKLNLNAWGTNSNLELIKKIFQN